MSCIDSREIRKSCFTVGAVAHRSEYLQKWSDLKEIFFCGSLLSGAREKINCLFYNVLWPTLGMLSCHIFS